jgi:hypothetical protein
MDEDRPSLLPEVTQVEGLLVGTEDGQAMAATRDATRFSMK